MAARWTSRCPSCRTRAAAGRALLALLFACLLGTTSGRAQPALAVTLHSRAMQPGELVLADITAPADTGTVSVSVFGSDWPAFRTDTGTWRAPIGIDLDARPGSYPLLVRRTGPEPTTLTRMVVVLPKQFRRRTLRVAPEFVDPPPQTVERLEREAVLMREAYATTDPEARWRDGFSRPVDERANSSFGTRSVFNGKPRNPHAGTDFLSPSGTLVHAPAGGRVVVARDLFFTGNTVVLDHGLGVFSMLAHLSRLDVHEGQVVTRGEGLGAVGATGRVTGPHLHWALRLGTARVDAMSALALLPVGR